MATRTYTETMTRSVQVCDRCGKRMDSPHRCAVCGRECGYCCASLRCCYDTRAPGMLDLAFTVCDDCATAGADVAGPSFLDLMRAEIGRADTELDRLMGRWKEWAKERREQGQP